MGARTPRLLFTATLGAAIAVWAAHPLPVAGQASANSAEDRQLLGTWKLNLAKSKYKIGAPPQSQTRTYEPQGEGVKATISTTFSNGRSTTVGYVAKYDSHEYPVTGSPDADTITLKKIAPRTAEVVLLHAGKHMATVRREISEDGQTMTISYEGELLGDHVDYVAVYDKQK
jgi:hypothetical protein